MADAACVARSLYEPPKNANNGEEGESSVPRLEGSISFGRYTSESLEWGKWSSFRQNRHIDEAEKYSKPGSVAQKKAYFEHHYRRKLADQKAAALLEQANASVTGCGPVDEETIGDGGNHENGHTDSVHTEQPQLLAQSPVGATANVAVQESDFEASAVACPPKDPCSNEHDDSGKLKIDQQGGVMEDQSSMELPSRNLPSIQPNNPYSERERHGFRKSEEKGIEVENQTPGEAPSRIISTDTIGDVENQNAMAHVKPSRTCQKPPLQESSAANREISASKEKKQKVLVSKWPIFSRTFMASPLPVKPATSCHLKRENVSKLNKKYSHDMNERKISAPKSLHMSINLSSQKANETTPPTIQEKNGDSRLMIRSSKASPGTPHCESSMKTSAKVSAAGVPKVVLSTPSISQSTRMPSQKTDPKKINPMCQSVSTDCWKSSSSSWKRPSQIVFSPFSFRCEERAERRKVFVFKLEEKLNAEKLQRQAKDKELTENELQRLRQSLGFKARPMPDFYRKTAPKD